MYHKIATSIHNNEKKYIIYIILSVIFIIFILYLFKNNNNNHENNQTAWQVYTIPAEKTSATPELTLFGTIINPFTSKLKSTIEAYVEQVNIKEGMYANKNDILVILDKSDITLDTKQKQAFVDEITAKIKLEAEQYKFNKKNLIAEKKQLELIEKNYERQKSLRKKNLNSAFNLDEAEIEYEKTKITYYQRLLDVESYEHKIAELNAELEKAIADLNQYKLNIERANIKAPFNGYISSLNVSPGTRVMPGDIILEIFNQDSLEIKLQIPESTIATLRSLIKNKEQIKASANIENKNYELIFRSVTANQDVTTGGTDAFFTFKNKNNQNITTIGKTVSVTLKLLELHDVFLIPEPSLYYDDRIYIVENNKLKSIKVNLLGTTIINNKQLLIINSNELKPDDNILSSVLPAAIDGLKVKIIN